MSFDASALIRGLGDTIVAVSTAAGFAERGVVRVSGDRAVDVAQAWFECAEGIDDDLRYGVRDGSFRLGNSGVVVSASLWVMRAPRSYTGEDQVEIHLVGSPTLLDVVVDLCCRAGARAAAPGEFTRRALFNGRLDLTQAEAVGALVTAATEDERRAAIEVLDGSVKIRTDAMTETLMAWLATIELDLVAGLTRNRSCSRRTSGTRER